MDFLNLVLILCSGILLQKGQEAYSIPVNEVPSKGMKVLEYEIGNRNQFHEQDLEPKAACNRYVSCYNMGQCINGTCICPPGISGIFCEIIDACDELDCKAIDGECIYDKIREVPTCFCINFDFVYVNKQCVVPCENGTQCQEGEKCKADGEGASKYCQCPKGRSGNKCSIINDCVSGTFRNCKGDQGTCKYDEEAEKAFCECKDDKSLDPTVAFCKETCKGSEDCQHDAKCVKNRGVSRSFCKCKSPFEGDFCELVKECRLVKFDNCKGENGTCVHSKEEKRAVCVCGEKKKLDRSDTTCKDCYCGENGNCTITKGVKTCICNTNYTEGSDGICHKCDCGKHSTACEFDRRGMKICECESGYSPKNGTCTDNTITDTKKGWMIFSIQREIKQNEVYKFYGFPS